MNQKNAFLILLGVVIVIIAIFLSIQESEKKDIGSQLEVDLENKEKWACGDSILDEKDNQNYKTVKVGDQCWMAENMKYLPDVAAPTIGSSTEPYYYVYNYFGLDIEEAKLKSSYNDYGVLYNWPAAMNKLDNAGAQGICPNGWHLPTRKEWEELISYAEPNAEENLKTSSLNLHDWVGTDSIGFNVFPSGYVYREFTTPQVNSRFVGAPEEMIASFWTSSRVVNGQYKVPEALLIGKDWWGITIEAANYSQFGKSVRCVKN